MNLARVHIGIVGGGIGGLTAAIALACHGANVRVFERAGERRREGIALLLWANAMHALASIGVHEVAARAMTIDVTEIRNARGDLLCELPIAEWNQSSGASTVAVRRPDLVAALARALAPEAMRAGVELASYAVCGDKVIARFTGGDEVEVDALIGADGLNSTVRTQLLGTASPRALHQHAWVGIARGVSGLLRPGVTTASIGRGPRFWAAALDDDSAFWYATVNHTDTPSGPAVEYLSRELADWHAPIQALLAASHDDDIAYTQIHDRPPVDRWGTGPVTLLGDAAHASTPDLGQGACQAIESAVVLADCLARAAAIVDGLRDYERRRMERTATISRLCWLTSIHSTIQSAALCSVRDSAIRIGLRTLARGHLTWILAGPRC
jgi:2-polyprenyl-6-methoxyphenol hydroxylase-like FAD-dependent oxidoreductase